MLFINNLTPSNYNPNPDLGYGVGAGFIFDGPVSGDPVLGTAAGSPNLNNPAVAGALVQSVMGMGATSGQYNCQLGNYGPPTTLTANLAVQLNFVPSRPHTSRMIFTQDATGGRTVTWSAVNPTVTFVWLTPDGSAPNGQPGTQLDHRN
ncbi:MAG: hypothetical protein WDN27_02040 [Candidatus Saccharibacteria bacterium]